MAPQALPPFQPEALDARFGGDAELKQVALSAFRASTQPLLQRLGQALAAADRQAVVRLAHAAKGAGLMVSAARYAAFAERLEERAPHAPPQELQRLVEDLQRAFDAFVAVVEAGADRAAP